MVDFPKWKKYLSILTILASFFVVYYDFSQRKLDGTSSSGIKLGLDLQGGSYIVLEASLDLFKNEYKNSLRDALYDMMIREKISFSDLNIKENSILFRLEDRNDLSKIRNYVINYNNSLNVLISQNTVTVDIEEAVYKKELSSVVSNSLEIVRRRIDQAGTNEPNIRQQGYSQIVVELPGIDDPERIKRILKTTARLSFHLVDKEATFQGATAKPGYKRVLSDDGYSYVIKSKPELYGTSLTNAKLEFQENKPTVFFSFDNEGGATFARVTQAQVGNLLAIVIDNKVISAPVINSAITGGSGIISGSFTLEEAQDLALLLKAGSLPVPLELVEERTVGPTLGKDSIRAGLYSGLFGYLLVFIFMLVFYKKLGFVANLSLIVNTIFVLSLLSLIGATLTLPGIAGIILTTGMAVDANILVYERLNQEIRNHKASFLLNLSNSFKRSFLTIVDSNVTTLLTAILLFGFGSGPVRGFAVTLIIGILCSMFSISFISRFFVGILFKDQKYKRVIK